MRILYSALRWLLPCCAALLLFPPQAAAQCIPAQNLPATPGIYPDSLPAATGCQPYQFDVSFVLPRDTTVTFAGQNLTFPFISFTVKEVQGLPQGLQWECNKAPACLYVVHPDSAVVDTVGCIRVSGTPTVPATYNITVLIDAVVVIFGTPTVNPFTYEIPLVVTPCQFTGDCYTLSLNTNCAPAILDLDNNVPSNGISGFSYLWQITGPGGFVFTTTDEAPFPQFLAQAGEYQVSYQAQIDTVGYILNAVEILTVDCSDIGSAGDLYWKLFDPQGNELVNTSASPVNNGGAALPLNANISGIFLQPGSYEFQVWDEDAVLADQGCATGSMGSGASVSLTVPPPAVGANVVTNSGLSVRFTVDKPIQTISCADTFRIDALPPLAEIFAGSDTLPSDTAFVCSGDTLFLRTSAADSVQWFRNGAPIAGATDTVLAVLQAGSYSLDAIDRGSFCRRRSASVTVEVFILLPPSIAYDGSGTLLVASPNPAYEYRWYDQDRGLEGSGSTWQLSTSGNYYCVVRDPATGCVSGPSPVIRAIPTAIDPLAGLLERFELAPNPAQDRCELRLGLARPQAVQVQVSDLAGRSIWSRSLGMVGEGRFELPVSQWPAGLYLLQVILPEGAARQRLVVR
ncbi:MAG: T9SS type A sorting domain-containing protein [Bacteroidia bacterium]|nr:T9SS type A sorting domain-containing protein [Bacteroidia bacterium]